MGNLVSSKDTDRKSYTLVIRIHDDDEDRSTSKQEVSQFRPLKANQVKNRSGAYVWQVNDMMKLQRFIFLGSDNSFCYKAVSNEPKRADAACIDRLIAEGRGLEVVQMIKDISLAGRAARQNPTIFALALCARSNDIPTKKAAYEALTEICRIPTHLFMFIKYCEKESSGTGWGRAHRNAVVNWYMTKSKNPVNAVRLITKYKRREGFTHTDVLRLAHPKPADLSSKLLFKFVTKGFKAVKELLETLEDAEKQKYESNNQLQNMYKYMEAADEAKRCTDEDRMVELIDTFSLEREHITTQLLKSRKVWEALVKNLKMEATVRQLGKITQMGLCMDGSWVEKALVERLTNEELIKQYRTHPFKFLLALHTYKRGMGDKGSLRWIPNPQVLTALEEGYYKAFKFVPPTNKRFCLAVDVSGSMNMPCVGSNVLNCKLGAAAMMMVTARTETNYDVVAFSHKLIPMDIKKTDTLPDVLKKMEELPFGGTDCALPMIDAQERKKMYDVFIVYTDSETWYGKIHPSRALQEYREAMNNPDAKLIVVGMASNGFTIADPDDLGMLDVVGFDAGAPETIAKFSLGEM